MRTTIPAPSPRTYPLAPASKAWQCPSGERNPLLAKPAKTWAWRSRFEPPASASSDSPSQRLRQARWIATSEDEQAVSIARLGPRKSKKCEIRLAAMLPEFPVTRWAMAAPPRFAWINA